MARVAMITVLLCCLGLTAAASDSNESTVAGIIVDATGASFPESRVLLVDLSTFATKELHPATDAKFQFSGLAPGRYVLIAADRNPKSCFIPTVQQMTLKSKDSASVRLVVQLDAISAACKQRVY